MLSNFLNFNGKVGVKDFWLTMLENCIVAVFFSFFALPLVFDKRIFLTLITALVSLYVLVIIIPTFSLVVRRLNDAGFSTWLLLVVIVPIFGEVALLILLCQPSVQTNRKSALNKETGNMFGYNSTMSKSLQEYKLEQTSQNLSETILAEDDEQEETMFQNQKITTDEQNKIGTENVVFQREDLQNQSAEDDRMANNQINLQIDDELEYDENQTEFQSREDAQFVDDTTKTRAERIRDLQKAREDGLITEEEYRKKSLKILR